LYNFPKDTKQTNKQKALFIRRLLIKKHSQSFLLFALLISLLCGCADKQKQPANTEPTATEPVTEPATQAPTEAPTEPATEAPTQPEGLQLNMDLLNDVGRTYDELTEKYGELTKIDSLHGGLSYQFENGFGIYNFSLDSSWNAHPLYIQDPDTHPLRDQLFEDKQGKYIPLPKEDAKCCSIEDIIATELFIISDDTILISDIKNIDGMTVSTETHEHALDFDPPTPGAPKYVSTFILKGYEHIIIAFSHEEFESIDSSSILDLLFPPKR